MGFEEGEAEPLKSGASCGQAGRSPLFPLGAPSLGCDQSGAAGAILTLSAGCG